jgi:hypothetical protein
MPDYLIVGSKGSGKSLFAVQQMESSLQSGLKVCTNIHLFVERIENYNPNSYYLLLPEVPASYHISMDSVGIGNFSGVYNDQMNGALVLDEVSEILQARNWLDGDRAAVIHEIIHLRKRMWNTYYITHGLSVIDSQIRNNHIDKVVVVYSLKNKYSFARRYLPDIFILRIYDKTYSESSPKKHLLSRHLIYDLHLQKLYKTNEIFENNEVVTVSRAFRIDPQSRFIIPSPKSGGKLLTPNIEIDVRVVSEMIPPQYADCFPERPPYYNSNTLFKYIFGAFFLLFNALWKYLFLAGVLFILYLFVLPIFDEFIQGFGFNSSKDDLLIESNLTELTHEPVANDSLVATSVESPNNKGDELVARCNLFSDTDIVDYATDDLLLSNLMHNDFKIKDVFDFHGVPKYSITFYDYKGHPSDILSSSELDYLGWKSFFWGFKNKNIAITNGTLSILYPIDSSLGSAASSSSTSSSSIIDSFFSE